MEGDPGRHVHHAGRAERRVKDPAAKAVYDAARHQRLKDDPMYKARRAKTALARYHRLMADPTTAEQVRARERNRTGRPRVQRERAVRVVREKAVRVRVSKPQSAPSEVRSLWGRADENSMIRRRYPTIALLNAAHARGELRVSFCADASTRAATRALRADAGGIAPRA